MSSVHGSNAACGLRLTSSSYASDDDNENILHASGDRGASIEPPSQDEHPAAAPDTEQAAQKLAQDMLALMAALMAALQSNGAPASTKVQAAAKAVLADAANIVGTSPQRLTPAEQRTIVALAESGNLSLDQMNSAYDMVMQAAMARTGPVIQTQAAGNDLPHHSAGTIDMKRYA